MAYVFDPIIDFQEHLSLLKEDPEKKDIVEKYEKNYWTIVWGIKDQIRYKDYVSQFSPVQIALPLSSKDDFDWELFIQLVASSLSSECALIPVEWDVPQLSISVDSSGSIITKKVDELYWFQVFKLYQIYIEEQLSMQNHIAESEWEKEEVTNQRNFRIKKWKLTLDYTIAQEEIAQEEAAKWDALADLYSKLG